MKKQGQESAVHTYVVETLRKYFWKHNIRPRRWISVGSDLLVRQKFKRKRLAIEVETGHAYRMEKDKLKNKFKHLSIKFDVVIILTDSFYLARYKSLFPKLTVLLRKDALSYFSRRIKTLGFNRQSRIYYRRAVRHPRMSLSTMIYMYQQENGSTDF